MDQISDRAQPAAMDASARLFAGGGEMGKILAGIDWSRTTLGPVETWPLTLRTSLRICLTSRHDFILWWGPELLVFYNDAYAPTLGAYHPAAAGRPGREVWSEIWDVIGPMLEGVLRTGQPTWSYDQLLYLERNGFSEETYHTYSYSPIEDDSGAVGGVFTAVTETTLRVLAERRAVTARDLAAAVVDTRTSEEVCERAMGALASDPNDVPFALLYLLDRDGRYAWQAATVGLPDSSSSAVFALDLEEPGRTARGRPGGRTRANRRGKRGAERTPEHAGQRALEDALCAPLARVARSGQRELISDLPYWPPAHTAAEAAASERPGMASRAVALPITEPGQAAPSALLVVGVSQHRTLDEDYERFYALLASHIASALASAHAYEDERRRAEALAEIDRAKTAFFSNVSHEFRTPLTLMLGPLEDSLTATDEPLTPHQRERLEVMRRNGRRLLRLVNTLLDFARIEAGREQAVYEPTDLATYTAELASSFRSLIERAGMKLIINCPPLEGQLAEPVYVDREMWEKIVLNLVSNAFKFTFAGSITVAVYAIPDERGEGATVELVVRDTGAGIPAAELPRLFERFHRVQGALSRSYEGSGIGLALVAELIHLHGGTIRAESVEGAGTTFFVRLPTGADHLPADRIRARREHASTAVGAMAYVEEAGRWLSELAPDEIDTFAGSDGQSGRAALSSLGDSLRPTPLSGLDRTARILIADDNADMRDYLRRVLSERYDDVRTAPDGAAALASVRARPPDLVLSDVMMPHLDGFGLLRALKDDPATAAIPVILLSARAGEEATVEGLSAGADDYLVKPFSAREVLARVAARLEISQARREAAERASLLEAVFAALPGRLTIFDETGAMIQLNRAAQVVAGPERTRVDIADVIQIYDLRTADGAPVAIEDLPLTRALRGETVVDAELYLRDAEGRDRATLAGAAPYYDETGHMRGVVSVAYDITGRRQAEEAAATRARQLEAIFEAAADGLALYDEQGNLREWNASLAALFEFDRQPDYPKQPASQRIGKIRVRNERGELLPLDKMPFIRALHGETLTGPRAVDLVISLPSGQDKEVSASAAPLRDAAGRVTGAVTLYRDVTERRQIERRSQESLAALLQMAEALVAPPQEAGAAPGAAGPNTPGQVEAVQRVLALVRGAFLGQITSAVLVDIQSEQMTPIGVVGASHAIEARWWREVRTRPAGAYLPPPLLKRLSAGEPIEFDLQSQPPVPGADYFGVQYMLAVAQPLTNGQHCVLLIDARDRSAFTPQEYELARAAVRLVALVVERERLTSEREEGRMRELALEEATRRMDTFLGIASHEMRTPLTSLTANIQLAGRQLRAARQSAAPNEEKAGKEPDGSAVAPGRLERAGMLLERAERQVTRLDRLVSDFLDTTRIHADKLEMRLEICDLSHVAREAVLEQRTAWPGRAISLEPATLEALPIYADGDRIGQVVTNLLTNALKYSADHLPVAVRVRAQGRVARVEARDQGPGLTPEQQEHLFERFYRAPGIEEQNGPRVGLGLGLYICKTIVERHGGQIGVESVPGEGSTFWFTIPLAEPGVEPGATPPS